MFVVIVRSKSGLALKKTVVDHLDDPVAAGKAVTGGLSVADVRGGLDVEVHEVVPTKPVELRVEIDEGAPWKTRYFRHVDHWEEV